MEKLTTGGKSGSSEECWISSRNGKDNSRPKTSSFSINPSSRRRSSVSKLLCSSKAEAARRAKSRRSSNPGPNRCASFTSSRTRTWKASYPTPLSARDEGDIKDGSENGNVDGCSTSTGYHNRMSMWKTLARKVFKNLEEGEDKNDGTENSVTGAPLEIGKKKSFSGKWLPNIRKLSQGKLEKGVQDGRAALLQKQASKTRIKLSQTTSTSPEPAAAMGNKFTHGEASGDTAAAGRSDPRSSSSVNGVAAPAESSAAAASGIVQEPDGEEPVAEVPPPMMPMSSIPVFSSADDKQDNWNRGETGKPVISLAEDPSSKAENCDESEDAGEEQGKEDSVEKAMQQRHYRLQELLESEKVYVKDLEQCCEYIKYMRESKDADDAEIPMPDDLRDGKDRMIFGNIEAIYEWHRDYFLKNLQRSIENPVELGNLFTKYDRKFQMYVVYCQNKPKSEFIVSEYVDTYFEEIRLKHGFKLRITDLLIKPIQRLTKYHMLLEAVLKYSERAGLTEEASAISRAFHVMTVVPNQANEMMDIGRLQGFEGKITAQGKLMHRGPLNVLDTFSPPQNGPPKMKPFTCFLFEQMMIFSEVVGKKTQFTSPVYVYKSHFLVNKMTVEERSEDGDPLKFLLKSNDPARDELTIVCQAEDEASKKVWTGIMMKQLQKQMDFLRALQAPIAYHKLAKDYADPGSMSHLWEVVDLAKEALRGTSSVSPSCGRKMQKVKATSSTAPISSRQPENKVVSTPRAKGQEAKESSSSKKTAQRRHHTHHIFDNLLGPFNAKPSASNTPLEGDPDSHEPISNNAKSRQKQVSPEESPDSVSSGLIRRWSESSSRQQQVSEPYETESSLSSVISVGSTVTVLVDYRPVKVDEIQVSRGQIVDVVDVDPSRGGYLIRRQAGEEGWVPTYVLNLLASNPRRTTWTFRRFQKPPRPSSGGPLSPSQPKVQDLKGTSAVLTWDHNPGGKAAMFVVESCRLRSNEAWIVVRADVVEAQCTVSGLRQGETYSFRVTTQTPDGERSTPSAPSAPLMIPLDDDTVGLPPRAMSGLTESPNGQMDPCWQRDFERRFIELEELGRGRFGVVRRCQEILSGTEVAVKFIQRRKQLRKETLREYNILSVIDHPNLVRSTGLFVTSTSDAIILNLVSGTPLFEHFCKDTTYSESSVRLYMRQLLGGLSYLHERHVVHLDLKPENLLLDVARKNLHLIDFGSAKEIQPRRFHLNNVAASEISSLQEVGSLEFLAPEVISSGPISTSTDMWGVGVLLYVCLSGLSPFLDDSDDETTRNILRCDFSFPDEYFSDVSNEAKYLIRRLLHVNPTLRATAAACGECHWLSAEGTGLGPLSSISSVRLCTLVRRRMKKLNNMAPLPVSNHRTRLIRPESIYYKNLPS